MKNKRESAVSDGTIAQPRFHQRASEIQAYGTVNHLLSLELEETVRLEMTAQLNQLLADTMSARWTLDKNGCVLAFSANPMCDTFYICKNLGTCHCA